MMSASFNKMATLLIPASISIAVLLALVLACSIANLTVFDACLPSPPRAQHGDRIIFLDMHSNSSVTLSRESTCDAARLFHHRGGSGGGGGGRGNQLHLFTEVFSYSPHYKSIQQQCYFHSLRQPIFYIDCHLAQRAFSYFCNLLEDGAASRDVQSLVPDDGHY